MNKKAFLGKLLLIVIFLFLILVLLIKVGYAETSNVIANITVKVNATDIILNVSNSIYIYNNTNFNASFQQSFPVFFEQNISVVIQNVTNGSISVFCSCPSVVAGNCSIGAVELKNETRNEIFNHYVTNLGSQLTGKIDETSSKIAQDVIFRLEPAKAELEKCKQDSFNASLEMQDALRQRDQQLEANYRIAGLYEDKKSENKLLLIFALILVFVSMLFLALYFGFFSKSNFSGGEL